MHYFTTRPSHLVWTTFRKPPPLSGCFHVWSLTIPDLIHTTPGTIEGDRSTSPGVHLRRPLPSIRTRRASVDAATLRQEPPGIGRRHSPLPGATGPLRGVLPLRQVRQEPPAMELLDIRGLQWSKAVHHPEQLLLHGWHDSRYNSSVIVHFVGLPVMFRLSNHDA
jgi:hypothetical protein